MELIEGQRVLLLHAGDYHVINSAAVHATRTTTPSRVLLLQIPYAFLIGAIPEYESIRFLFSHRDSSADAQIQEILTSMGDLYTKKPQSYTLRFSGLLYDFLYILMTHYKVTVDSHFSGKCSLPGSSEPRIFLPFFSAEHGNHPHFLYQQRASDACLQGFKRHRSEHQRNTGSTRSHEL